MPRHDDPHHVTIRKDAQGLWTSLAAAVAVGHALPERHARGRGVRPRQEPRALDTCHHRRRRGADSAAVLLTRRRRCALALPRRPIRGEERRTPRFTQRPHPWGAPTAAQAPGHHPSAAPHGPRGRIRICAIASDAPERQHRFRLRPGVPPAAHRRQRHAAAQAVPPRRARCRQARVVGLHQGGHH